MSKIQPPRGTGDLMPLAMAKHRKVIDNAKNCAEMFGFAEMATPIFEFTDVFARPLGESSDVVAKETYSFTDRGGEGVTLRPEGTAAVVRALISGGLTQTLPQKFFYAGPMFRYERPQKGRMRQFHQIGVELLGVSDASADAEVIVLGQMILSLLGVADRCVLHLNTLGDAESRLSYRGALVSYFTESRDKLSEDSRRRLEVNPMRILDSKDAGDCELLTGAPVIDDFLTEGAKDHFNRVMALLDAAKITYRLNAQLVRGLDYYCHTAFEFITDDLGAQGTVMGGGRYDGLAAMLGGGDVPGVGWAAGIDRLALLIDEPTPLPQGVMMLGLTPEHEATLFAHAMPIRQAGIRVEIAYGHHLAKQMKRADKLGLSHVIILGDDEAGKGLATLREMASGSQHEVPLECLSQTMIDACGKGQNS